MTDMGVTTIILTNNIKAITSIISGITKIIPTISNLMDKHRIIPMINILHKTILQLRIHKLWHLMMD